MIRMKKYNISILIFFVVLLWILPVGDLLAQCPMCRMSAESNLENGGSAAKGLNNGILYIFAFPYILVSILGFVWWKHTKNVKAQHENDVI